jgi:hypothetical protein
VVANAGEMGAGVWGELGGKIAAALHAQAYGTAGVGARTEMTFATADEAKRAAHLLVREKQATLLLGLSPAVGALGARALSPNDEERKFLNAHVTAVHLYGDGVADLNGIAGVTLSGVVRAGAFGDASVVTQHSLRLELAGGRLTGLTLQHQMMGDANLTVGVDLDGEKNDAWMGGLLGGDASALVTSEFHVPPPPGGLSLERLMHDPAGTLKAVLGQVRAQSKGTITVDLTRQSVTAGAGVGTQWEARFEGDLAAIATSGALSTAVHGRFQEAAKRADGAIQIRATKTPFKQTGINLDPGVSLMGVGAELLIQAGSQLFGPPLMKYPPDDSG